VVAGVVDGVVVPEVDVVQPATSAVTAASVAAAAIQRFRLADSFRRTHGRRDGALATV
jgi:hypothetical protein